MLAIGRRESLGVELGLNRVANPLVEQLLPGGIRRRYQSEGPKLGKAGGRTEVRTDRPARATGGQDQADANGDLSRSHLHMLLVVRCPLPR
jgi:hypothetical protein